jgi:hypothetical protein
MSKSSCGMTHADASRLQHADSEGHEQSPPEKVLIERNGQQICRFSLACSLGGLPSIYLWRGVPPCSRHLRADLSNTRGVPLSSA